MKITPKRALHVYGDEDFVYTVTHSEAGSPEQQHYCLIYEDAHGESKMMVEDATGLLKYLPLETRDEIVRLLAFSDVFKAKVASIKNNNAA